MQYTCSLQYNMQTQYKLHPAQCKGGQLRAKVTKAAEFLHCMAAVTQGWQALMHEHPT